MTMDLDGPGSQQIPDEEWASIKGPRSLALHHEYLAGIHQLPSLADDEDEH